MQRASLLIALVVSLYLAGLTSPAEAQRPGGFGGGPPSPDRMFDYLDRNQDGQLDASEIQQSNFLRDRIGQSGLDVSRPITKAQFSDSMQRVREQMESEGGSFRFGGPPPSSGSREPRDFRSDSDERREWFRFGDSGRGEEFRREDFRREDYRRDEGRSESGDRRDRGDSSSKSPASKEKKPKPRVTKELPDEYRDRDQNSDGQIGLYEWDRKAFAQFYELDRNSDGFLTPAELIASANKRTAKASGTAASKSSGFARNGSSGRPSGSSVTRDNSKSEPAKPGETPKSAGDSKSDADKVKKPDATESSAAVSAFQFLDQNHDGQLTQDEWERARSAKQKFDDAGIALSLPVNQAAFAALYRKTE
jgi:hypothetical protein